VVDLKSVIDNMELIGDKVRETSEQNHDIMQVNTFLTTINYIKKCEGKSTTQGGRARPMQIIVCNRILQKVSGVNALNSAQ